jgi:hypothetical protein
MDAKEKYIKAYNDRREDASKHPDFVEDLDNFIATELGDFTPEEIVGSYLVWHKDLAYEVWLKNSSNPHKTRDNERYKESDRKVTELLGGLFNNNKK